MLFVLNYCHGLTLKLALESYRRSTYLHLTLSRPSISKGNGRRVRDKKHVN